jgi:hypothetical protein
VTISFAANVSIVARIVRLDSPSVGPGGHAMCHAKCQMTVPDIVAMIDGKSSYRFRRIVGKGREGHLMVPDTAIKKLLQVKCDIKGFESRRF